MRAFRCAFVWVEQLLASRLEAITKTTCGRIDKHSLFGLFRVVPPHDPDVWPTTTDSKHISIISNSNLIRIMRKLTQETYDRRSASGAYDMAVVLGIVWYQTIFRYGESAT